VLCHPLCSFSFIAPAPSVIFPLSLHDALPICPSSSAFVRNRLPRLRISFSSCASSSRRVSSPFSFSRRAQRKAKSCSLPSSSPRSEEHTSELQSRSELVCRLLLEKKKQHNTKR